MSRCWYFLVMGGLCWNLLACTVEKKEDALASTSPDLATEVQGSPLYLYLTAQYEGGTSIYPLGACYIDPASGSTTENCEIRVPELVLYHANLSFTVGTSSEATCEQVSFTPYHYLRSDSATYKAYTGSTTDVDCSEALPKKECWGGIAEAIMGAAFPLSTSVFFLPKEKISTVFTAKSSNARRVAATTSDQSFHTNVNVANNLTARGAGTTNTGTTMAYMANTMQDYQVNCYDKWSETLYQLNLIIGDDDITDVNNNNTVDQFYDWGD